MGSSVRSDKDKLYSSHFLSNVASPPVHQASLPTLSIHNSLTGKKTLANSYRFNSLDSLKEYISSCFNIPVTSLFILTPFGIKLKFSMILHDQVNELYVFDRNCFNLNEHTRAEIQARLKEVEPFSLMKPTESPLLAFNGFKEDNLRGSINALKRNSGWAAAVLSDFKKSRDRSLQDEEDGCIEVILRSLNVLVQYLSLSSQTLQKNLDASIEYLSTLKENSLISTWNKHYQTLKKINFKLTGRDINLSNSISKAELTRISKEASIKSLEVETILQSVSEKIENEIKTERHKLENDCLFLKKKYYTSSSADDGSNESIGASQILKLQSLVEQIVEDINDLPGSDTNDVEYVRAVYNRHHDDLIPEIANISNDLYKKHSNLNKNKTLLQENLFDFVFMNISKIQISLINIQKTITNELHPRLTSLQSLEIKLSIVIDLPLIFGILIISKYKNYRWFQNFKKICYKTNEIFEMLQFLEASSRSKWVGNILGNNGRIGSKNENGFLSQYQEFLGVLKEEDFVGEHMAVAQLIFEAKQNNKITIDTSVNKNTNNKALNKFITSLNNNLSANGAEEGYNLWSEIQVTSIKDIESYIAILKKVLPNENVVRKLEKNVSDCGFDDNATFNVNDLSFMKFYKKFLKNYEMDGFTIEFGSETKPVDKRLADNGDISKDVIKGYENRVKMLENLLHQQQFLQFNQQFAPRQLNPLNAGTLNDGVNSVFADKNRQQISLPRNRKFSSNGNVVDEVEDIKHAENSEEQKKQIRDLTDQNQEQKQQISDLSEENAILKRQIEELKQNQAKATSSPPVQEEEKLTEDLQSTKFDLAKANETIFELNEKLKALTKELEDQKSHWEQNYEEVNSMKNDLIENMSSLRKDHEEESVSYLKQIEDLNFKIEELEVAKDEFQCANAKMGEFLHDKNQVIEGLTNIVDSMYMKLKELSQRVFVDLSILCVILESIGLLLVEEDGEKKIIRVKGLKKNKNVKAQITSNVISQGEKNLYWTDLSIENETTSVKDMIRDSSPADSAGSYEENSISELDIHSKSLVHKFDNESFETNYLAFINSFELSDDLLINSITKRFKDVENLARKFQKDLNIQKVELNKLSALLKSKISITSFGVDDLVLFLPTTEEFNQGNLITKQWAAFNIGAPHFFLRNVDNGDKMSYIDLTNRDWLVARILKLQEFQITEENFNSETLNPFKLSIGVSWYYVDAKEEILEQ